MGIRLIGKWMILLLSSVYGVGAIAAAPTILSFNPTSGLPGASVTLQGTNFTTAANSNEVCFAGPIAGSSVCNLVAATSTTQLSTTVPSSAVTGPISVINDNGTGYSSTNFTVIVPPSTDPTITSFSPTSGLVGSSVALVGTNFTTAANSNEVCFAGVSGSVCNLVAATNSSHLSVTVPNGAVTGLIYVVNSNGTGYSSTNFTVIVPPPPTPTITSFSPTSGLVGSSVALVGTNFTTAANSNEVCFAGVSGSVCNLVAATNSSHLSVTVPNGAVTGLIYVVNSNGTGYSSTNFTVIVPPPPTPTITSFSPTSGLVGSSVALVGTNFTTAANSNEVCFAGVSGSVCNLVAATNSSHLSVTVPNGAVTGLIYVVNSNGTGYSSTNFTVIVPPPTPPTITGFSPTSGLVGTSVALTGTYYTTAANSNQVCFAGVAGSVCNLVAATNSSHLSVTVPNGAVTGLIYVVNSNGTGYSSTNFTVIVPPPPTPTITSFSPTSGLVGSSVALVGTNFTTAANSNEVCFAGVSGSVCNLVAATDSAHLSVTVPNGAVTGLIYVVNSNGTGYSSTNFTVIVPPPPTPTITSFSPTSGLVGSSVALVGTNFTTAANSNEVCFAGVSGSVCNLVAATDSAHLSVTVPNGAVTGLIYVVNSNGTGYSSTNFTVVVPPPTPPTITGFSPGSGPVGTVVTIGGTNFTAPPTSNEVCFSNHGTGTSGSYVCPLVTAGSTTSLTVTVPNGATTGPIEVVNSNGTGYSTTNFIVTTSAPTGLPRSPTSLSAPATNSTGSFNIAWTVAAPDGATYYTVQQATSPAGPWTSVGTSLPASASSATVTEGSGTYYFQVSACNTSGCSQPTRGTNYAAALTGGSAGASSVAGQLYGVSTVIDGDRTGKTWGNNGGWMDGDPTVYPDYVTVAFGANRTIQSVVLYTLQDNYAAGVDPSDTTTFTQYGITAFDVQAWIGNAWVTQGSVSQSNLVKRTVSFPAVTTNQVRVKVNASLGSGNSRIVELEALGLATTVVTAVSAPATPTAPSLATAPLDNTDSDGVGTSAGQFSVDQAGSAVYRVPLFTPKGAGGLTPSLAVTYNSSFGDGPLGIGWQLEGVSSISVCRKTQEHGDGIGVSSVAATDPSQSAYCLDNVRLDLVSGGNGAANAVYRLESDTYSKVVIESASTINGPSGATYSVPTTFLVYGKDGTLRRYGGNASGTQEAQLTGVSASGAIRTVAWYLAQIIDRTGDDASGNPLSVQYTYANTSSSSLPSSPVSLRLSSITYIGGSITFVYGRTRTSLNTNYEAQIPIAQSDYLTEIDVANGGTTLRNYRIGYRTQTNNPSESQVTTFTECAGTVCYPPTTFNWADVSPWSSPTPASQEYSMSDPAHVFGYAVPGSMHFGDIDGDGRADAVWVKFAPDDNYQQFHIGLSRPSSTGINIQASGIYCGEPADNRTSDSPNCPRLNKFFDPNQDWALLDYNGDGRDDLIMLEPVADSNPLSYQWVVWLAGTNPDGSPGFTKRLTTNVAMNLSGSPIAMALDRDFTNTYNVHSHSGNIFISDFDGDGLPDVFILNDTSATVWLLKPTGATCDSSSDTTGTCLPYRFQGPYKVILGALGSGSGCSVGDFTSGELHVADFNGDGKADIVLKQQNMPCNVSGAPQSDYYQIFKAAGISGSNFYFEPAKKYWQLVTTETGTDPNHRGVLVYDYHDNNHPHPLFQVADFNGDGLADVAFPIDGTSNNYAEWAYEINLGTGDEFGITQCVVPGCPAITDGGTPGTIGAEEAQFGDYDGDGRADFLAPQWNANLMAYIWNGNGFSPTPIPTPFQSPDVGTGNTQVFTFLADLDGDGYPDNLAIDINYSTSAAGTTRIAGHHKPRNVVTQVINGLGAETDLTYAPLTYSTVYYREYNGYRMATSGWGAPVQDELTPRYVVQYAQSSAPTIDDVSAMSTIRYQYAGMKVQGGGRGALGFHKVYSTDAQTLIQTVTTYNQLFPLSGTPLETIAYTNGDGTNATTDTVCGSAPDSAACMKHDAPADISTGQQILSDTIDTWVSTALGASGSPQPIFVFRSGSKQRKYGLDSDTNAVTTLVAAQQSSYIYDVSPGGANSGFGELLSSQTTDYAAVDAKLGLTTPIRSSTTTQTYGGDDIANWLLGRLSKTVTTVQGYDTDHVASSTAPLTRTSTFEYTGRGLLSAEHLQPPGSVGSDNTQAFDRYHFHDNFGNETEVVTCSATAACSSTVKLSDTAITFNPGDSMFVQRYSGAKFDSNGIYSDITYAPFWNGTTGVKTNTVKVDFRDAFGNPTQTTDNLHNVVTVGAYGALGRQYFNASSNGAAQTTTYTWCSNWSNCPENAVYVVDVSSYDDAAGTHRGPESWVYLDVLARPVFKVIAGFDDTQYIGIATGYDNLGRVTYVSEPFLTDQPNGYSFGGILSKKIGPGPGPVRPPKPTPYLDSIGTTTAFDWLGRPTRVEHPNNTVTTISYAGLSATTTMPANANNKIQTRRVVQNHLGKAAVTSDSNGSTISSTYDPSGDMVQIVRTGFDGKTGTSTMGYDSLGRKTSLNDADVGTWSFTYNAAGDMIKKVSTGATATCTTTSYDAQGRPHSRTDYNASSCSSTADTSTSWTYDTATNGLGSVASSTSSDFGNAYTQQESYGYDSLGRLTAVSTKINGTTYTRATTYDQYDRTFQTFFSGDGIPQTGELYLYNPQGYLYQTRDAENGYNGEVYREILSMDERMHVTSEMRAENHGMMATTRSYDDTMGWLTNIQSASGNTGIPTIQSLTYKYDSLGNITERDDFTDANNLIVELSPQYDNLQRLLTQTGGTTTASQVTVLNHGYDSLGNITTNGSDTLSYKDYGVHVCNAAGEVFAAGPDAVVTSSNGSSYCYDSRGNQTRVVNTSGAVLRSQTYASYDALRSASSASHTTSWGYGAARERIVRLDYASGSTSGRPYATTHYVGNAEIINPGTSSVIVKRYLEGMTLTLSSASGKSTTQYDYLFTDNIGSTHRITDETGAVRVANGAQRFSAFGIRTELPSMGWVPEDYQTGQQTDTSLTHHGFTGHEMMDETGLIHMDGRAYDPYVGRFIQADPFVSDGGDLQSLNRYSYLLNNPLASVDPTGYWGRRQQGYLRDVAAIAITVFSGWVAAPYVAAEETAEATAIVVAGGVAAGYVQTGNLKGAVLGGVEAGLDFGIGQSLPNDGGLSLQDIDNIGAHAALGGVMSTLRGGKFGHGFVAAGLQGAIDPHLDTSNTFVGTTQAAIVGGSISQLTGGKFANGALSAAFSFAFNASLSENQEAGKEAERWVVKALRADGIEVFEKVTITTLLEDGSSVEAVADYAYRDGEKLIFGEVKAGLTSKLSVNQKIVYAAIEKGKVAVVAKDVAEALGVRAGELIAKGSADFAIHAMVGSRAARQALRLFGKRAIKYIAGAPVDAALLFFEMQEMSHIDALRDECPELCKPAATTVLPHSTTY